MGVKVRHSIPNSLTFLSIACGLTSILMSSQGYLYLAGYLIFGSFLMDLVDGILARKLNVQSLLGQQLDSLADLVGLGIAPLVLIFHHISSREAISIWIIPFLVLAACSSAFRLARFNLLPPKSNNRSDSLGLTLFHTGFTLTVAVLSDLSFSGYSLPFGVYAGLLVVLSFSMICKLSFPPLLWFFSSRIQTIVIILCMILFLFFLPPFTTLFVFSIGHLCFSVGRGLYIKFSGKSPAK
ncbi:MAG: CDP-alcohol phosphatidyltransferase family protein [Anaerolineales bacterium]